MVVIGLKFVSLQDDKQLLHLRRLEILVVIGLKFVSLQDDKQPSSSGVFFNLCCDWIKIRIFAR